jgi:asparagine synthase (glutamine-hydrolysing)
MPGIVGLAGRGFAEEHRGTLRAMVSAMAHEPFYSTGTYANESLALSLGWIAHRQSFADCMPVWNEARDVCLIFAGEEFADASELRRLKRNGHAVDPGAASYLVHLYEELGIGFVGRLNGWFSGVVVDLRERKIVLFNDRYGLGRIYYHEHPTGFYFASEAKSLLRVLPELRELDLASLAETFSFGCVLENRTLFPKISLVPPGSIWTLSGGRIADKQACFSPGAWEGLPRLGGHEYVERLRDTFGRVVPKYLRGPQPVGMSLTGGLDGRMIMAWANPAPGALPCYSFRGPYRDCADVKIARRVAESSRQRHETIVVGPQFFAQFPDLAAKAVYVSDGAMDVTGAVELYVNGLARGIAPVRLTGNYGSEILRGNVAFRPAAVDPALLAPEFSGLVAAAPATYARQRQGHDLSFIAFKQVPWHHYSRFAVESSQATMRSPYLDNDLVALAYQAPAELARSQEPALQAIAAGHAGLAALPTDRGVVYPRVPVASAVRELAQKFLIKAEYACDYGMPDWLARLDRMLSPLHPERLFLGRHKFYHFRVWYRDRLRDYLGDVLLDARARSRPYIDGRSLARMVDDHIAGRRNCTSDLHRVLTAELAQRQLLEDGNR